MYLPEGCEVAGSNGSKSQVEVLEGRATQLVPVCCILQMYTHTVAVLLEAGSESGIKGLHTHERQKLMWIDATCISKHRHHQCIAVKHENCP